MLYLFPLCYVLVMFYLPNQPHDFSSFPRSPLHSGRQCQTPAGAAGGLCHCLGQPQGQEAALQRPWEATRAPRGHPGCAPPRQPPPAEQSANRLGAATAATPLDFTPQGPPPPGLLSTASSAAARPAPRTLTRRGTGPEPDRTPGAAATPAPPRPPPRNGVTARGADVTAAAPALLPADPGSAPRPRSCSCGNAAADGGPVPAPGGGCPPPPPARGGAAGASRHGALPDAPQAEGGRGPGPHGKRGPGGGECGSGGGRSAVSSGALAGGC